MFLKTFTWMILLVATLFSAEMKVVYDDVSTIKPENFPTNKDKFNVIEGDEANYQLFVGIVGTVTEKEKEVFFGKTADYKPFEEKGKSIPLSASAGTATMLTGQGNFILNAGKEALNYGITGAAFGVIFATIDPYVKEYYLQASMDTQYTYMVEFINKENKTVGKLSILFVADEDDYSEEEILQIIKNKKKEIK